MNKERNAQVIKTGKDVLVYRSSQRDTWINSYDLETEYKSKELKFLN